MPTQSGAVSGNRRKRNQIAELNARQSLLPQILANQRRTEDLGRAEELKNIQIDQFSRQHDLAKRGLKAQKRAGEVGAGLEAGKLGLTIAGRYGDNSFGQTVENTKGLFGYGSTPSGAAGTASGPGFFNNLSMGAAVGGGLAGFGAAKVLGGKSKIKKGLLGAGIGALMGAFTGGSGGMMSGGFGGALGGLFG